MFDSIYTFSHNTRLPEPFNADPHREVKIDVVARTRMTTKSENSHSRKMVKVNSHHRNASYDRQQAMILRTGFTDQRL